jgi:TolA-binding protein
MDVESRAPWRRLARNLLWAMVLTGCGTIPPASDPPCASVAPTSQPFPAESSVVQSLQQQLRERDRRIRKLQARLEALKLIDQDRRNRSKVRRPPATITPLE